MSLKRKNIFQVSNRKFIISSFVVNCILISIILVLLIYLKEREDIFWVFLFGIFFVVWGSAFIIAIMIAIKEIRKYNYLLEHGKVVKGRIISYSTHIQNGVTVKTTYYNEETREEYFYISKSPTLINSFKMRYFVQQDSTIDLLIDEKEMKNGVALIDEYYNEKLEKYGDKPYQLKNLFRR